MLINWMIGCIQNPYKIPDELFAALLLYLSPTISISAFCKQPISIIIFNLYRPCNIIILSFFNPWHQSRSFCVNSHWVFVLGFPPLRFFVYDKECGWISHHTIPRWHTSSCKNLQAHPRNHKTTRATPPHHSLLCFSAAVQMHPWSKLVWEVGVW